MNKKLCKYHKSKGTFRRDMCTICSYQSKCISYMEDNHGHSDEARDLSNPEAETQERS